MSVRFWTQVRKTETCWLWEGAIHHTGYGVFTVMVPHKHQVRVHRHAYQLLRGPIPNGLVICHRCDVRRCVNPDHLEPGTARENFHDAMRKGRAVHRPGALAGARATGARWADTAFRARRSKEISASNRRRRGREGVAS